MKKTFLTIFSIFTIFLISLIFVGCETNNKKEEKSGEPKKERLVMGLEMNISPLGYVDEEGKLTGFEVEMAKEVCDKLGKELVFKPIAWEDKENELNAGNIDFLWNGLSYTKDRTETMELSKAYMDVSQIVIFNKSINAEKLEDLKDKSFCTQQSTTSYDLLKQTSIFNNLKTAVQLNNVNECFDAVRKNESSAAVVDDIMYKKHVSGSGLENDFKKLKEPLSTGNYVIGFKKGNVELKNKFEEALQSLIDSKKAEEISKKWFGENLVYLKDVEK